MFENPEMNIVLENLKLAIEGVKEHFAGLDETDVTGLLKGFQATREFHDSLENELSKLGELIVELSYTTIPATFERLGIDGYKTGGKNYVVGVRVNASIPQIKREKGFKWLEDHGLGALVQPAVNSKTLSAAISSYFEEHAELPPEDAISLHRQTFTSVRKA